MGSLALGPMSNTFEAEDARESVLRNADILRLLFKDLDLEDLLRAASTCRIWFKVSQSAEFWASLDFSGRKVRASQVWHLLRHAHQSLDLSPDGAFIKLSGYNLFHQIDAGSRKASRLSLPLAMCNFIFLFCSGHAAAQCTRQA